MLSETQSMSVLVCVMLCYEPSPNTPPPQTHISHFGMMTLPVLASLTIILKLCSSFIVTFSLSPILLPFSFSYHLLSFTLVFISILFTDPPTTPLLLLILYSNPVGLGTVIFLLVLPTSFLPLTPFTHPHIPCGDYNHPHHFHRHHQGNAG